MASPRTRRLLGELRPRDSNNLCFECGTRNPQWASVSLAIFICLECSGKHRGVGVHLSFVRSLTMDKWKDAELAKMKVGGNDKAKKFLESQPDYSPSAPISQKYGTRAAELWRDKVKAESEGRAWDPAKAKVASSSLHRAKENRSSPALLQSYDEQPNNTPRDSRYNGSNSSYSSNSYNDINSRTTYNNSSSYSSGGGYNASPGGYNASQGGYNSGGGEIYTYGGNTTLQARDQFLANKMQENSGRADHLPPSQGGKYVGFGSTPAPQPRQQNEYMDTLSYWGSALATGATSIARAAGEKAYEVNENYIKPTAAKVVDPAFQAGVKDHLKVVGSRAAQIGSQGASMLAHYSEKGWNSVNQKYNNSSGYGGNLGISNTSYSNTGFGSGGMTGAPSGGGGAPGGGYQGGDFQDPTSLSSNMANLSVSDSYSSSGYNAGSHVTSSGGGGQDIFGYEQKKAETPGELDDWLNDGWDADWKSETKPRSRRKQTAGKRD